METFPMLSKVGNNILLIDRKYKKDLFFTIIL
jgi:hypothetical protein